MVNRDVYKAISPVLGNEEPFGLCQCLNDVSRPLATVHMILRCFTAQAKLKAEPTCWAISATAGIRAVLQIHCGQQSSSHKGSEPQFSLLDAQLLINKHPFLPEVGCRYHRAETDSSVMHIRA